MTMYPLAMYPFLPVLCNIFRIIIENEDRIIKDLGDIGPILIFAAIGMIAYSIYNSKIDCTENIGVAVTNRRYINRNKLYGGFLFFAVLNLSAIVLLFTCVLLGCYGKEIPFSYPFILLYIGVWLILLIAILDLLSAIFEKII